MTSQLIVIMGPSGCGKSTVGCALADQTGLPFLEGDDFHPAANRHKMASGNSLNDGDRAAWLDHMIDAANGHGGSVILACSALTKYVQRRLKEESNRPVRFCLLKLDEAALTRRVAARRDHFMPAELVTYQLAALHPPVDALKINAGQPVSEIVDQIAAALM